MLTINNTNNDIKIEGIQFKEVPINLANSFLRRLLLILDEKFNIINFKPEGNIFNFGGNKIYNLSGNIFLIEYEDELELNMNMKLLKNNFKRDKFSSKILEKGRQIPEINGYFRYKGKNYLIIESLNKKTDEINSELGIYKGVIVNPELYFGKVENQIDDIEDKIKDIL